MTHFSGTQSIDLCCESVDRFLFKWVVGVVWVGSLFRFAKHFAEKALGSLDSNDSLDWKPVGWFVLHINRLVLRDWAIGTEEEMKKLRYETAVKNLSKIFP